MDATIKRERINLGAISSSPMRAPGQCASNTERQYFR
jgi:hypothetical protein